MVVTSNRKAIQECPMVGLGIYKHGWA